MLFTAPSGIHSNIDTYISRGGALGALLGTTRPYKTRTMARIPIVGLES